jgi:enoyl-CoA hydratase
VRADEAHTLGILDRVVPADEVESTALHWAAELGKGAVVAMGLAKRVIDDGLGVPLADGLDREAEAFVEVFGTDDSRVGVESFLEHGAGKAHFSGR